MGLLAKPEAAKPTVAKPTGVAKPLVLQALVRTGWFKIQNDVTEGGRGGKESEDVKEDLHHKLKTSIGFFSIF